MTWASATALLGVLVSVLATVFALVNGKRSDSRLELERIQEQLDVVDKRSKALEDYCYSLRSDVAKAGLPVRPWPASLGGHDA